MRPSPYGTIATLFLQTIATLLLQPTFFGSADVWSVVSRHVNIESK
jgi:hypothetical protein